MVLVVSLEIKVMWLFICVGFSSAFTDDDARGLVPGRGRYGLGLLRRTGLVPSPTP